MQRARAVGIAAACVLWAPGIAMGAASPPTLTASVANGGSLSGAIATAISGHYAYIPGYYSGVVDAVDISDPTNPVVAGSSAWSSSLVNASTINVSNGYAYVVSKNRNGPNGSGSNNDGTGNSLTILDIATDPTHPAIVGVVRDAVRLFGAYGVAVQGNYAYVAAQGCVGGQPCPNPNVGDSFAVIDISSPASPTIVATLANSSLPAPWTGTGALKHPTAVAIAGNYAFVTASYTNRLTILDISNPLAPRIVASLQDASQLNFDVDVVVANGEAYVADQASGLGRVAVVDVHNPANPVVVGTVTNSTWLNGAYRIRALGNFVYVAATYSGAVSAIDVSNPAAPRFAGGYKSSAVLNRAPGLDIDPTGQFVIAVSPFLSTDPQPIYPPYPFDPGGPTLTGTVAVIALDPVAIAVAIAPPSKPPNPTTQTSANFTFATSDAVASVRCRLDTAPSGLCTSATTETYTSLTPGSHTFTVAATDAGGNVASDSYTWTITATQPSPGPGQTVLDDFNRPNGALGANWAVVNGGFTSFLVSSNQAVDSSTSVYAWTYWHPQQFGPDSSAFATVASLSADVVRVCARLTSPTIAAHSGYCVQEAASSWTIRRIDHGTVVTLGSTLSQPVAAGDRIGIVVVGSTIEAWYAPAAGSWTRVSSQTDATYSAAGFLAVEARGSRLDNFGGGTLGTASAPPSNTAPPTVSGAAQQGQTLTASAGTWTGNPVPTYAYQWQRCDTAGANCVDIASATGQTYQLLAADVGATVRIDVTATNSAGNSTAPSAATATVTGATAPPSNTAPPTVSGAAQQGQTLTASAGTWTGNPVPTYAYQWQRCDTAGANCVDIASATGQTYQLLAADVGATVRIDVTATNSAGNSTAPSAATATVTGATAPPSNTAPPTVSGAAQQGQTLTASAGTWTGNPVPTYAYQWQRCDTAGANCVDIASATGQTYQLLAADVGATVRIDVTATNSAGNSTAPSAATATVTGIGSGPQDAVLDSFNRANGAIGPNWGQIFGGFVDFAISGSEAVDPSASNFAWDYWAALQFGPDSEAYATITTLSTDAIRTCARMTNPTTSQRSGYCVQAAGNTWSIRRIDNGTATQLGAAATQTVGAGSRFGITVVGTTITAWYSPTATAGWTQVLTVTDSTYQGAGYIALEARGSHLDDFGGGTH